MEFFFGFLCGSVFGILAGGAGAYIYFHEKKAQPQQ